MTPQAGEFSFKKKLYILFFYFLTSLYLNNPGVVWPMHPTALLLTHYRQECVSHYTLDHSFRYVCVGARVLG